MLLYGISKGDRFDLAPADCGFSHVPGMVVASSNFKSTRYLSGDMDGDGKSDLVIVQKFNDKADILVAFSNGNGTFRYGEFATDQDFQDEDSWFLGDVDADGKADIMQVSKYIGDVSVAYDHADPGPGAQQATSGGSVGPTGVPPGLQFSAMPRFRVEFGGTPRTSGYRVTATVMGGRVPHRLGSGVQILDVVLARSRPEGTQYDVLSSGVTSIKWDNKHPIGVRPADVNGDGKTDVLLALGNDTPAGVNQRWDVAVVLAPRASRDASNWKPAHVNRDGRADMIWVRPMYPGAAASGVTVTTKFREATGALAGGGGWSVSPSPQLPGA